ncbi:hypothetical protein MLD38_009680 [Melastoma candidum]|uniref:Uncharacterized protein n=2 Tax=Melastoma candidum TaxID=119954 RepID=A0ACB9RYG6_9MYRT|nr:hypothetical protein MLD38_009680 [Melastoma candidum]
MGSYRMCLCFTRKFKVTEAEPPSFVKDSFSLYSQGGSSMSPSQLRLFLQEVQGWQGSDSDAHSILDQFLRHRHHHFPRFSRANPTLTLDDFHHLLFSPDFNPPIESKVHQDMNSPLSHYFIFTGHNSYLTGNQLSSDCSDVPIIKALQRGVRVIELDIWPNPSKDDIHVLHGRTLTTPVELVKCLRSIKEHAFHASPYPVVITLEDHLTADLQEKVAQMLTQTFGDMLYYPEAELKEFPSPEELKYRVLISTKPPKEYLEAKNEKQDSSLSQKDKDSDEDVWGKEPTSTIIADSTDQKEGEKVDGETNETNDNDAEESDECETELCLPGGPIYKRLITIHAGKPKGGLEVVLKVEVDKVRRLSLSEQELKKAAESHSTEIVRFTQKNFLRIYPKGTRFNSSNYKPLVGWLHGAQMVAFNMQGYGRYLWLMHGMFRANGGCGYIKKPDLLMNVGPDGNVFDPKAKYPVKKTLKVTVFMGDGWHLDFKQTHFDLYSPPDFYTRVGIAGVPADTLMKETKKIEDNWTPVWNEEFTFPLTVPELALLRVEVHEYDMTEKDDFAGQNCLPVWELKQGIRAVPLFDRKGDKLSSVRLLMRFEFI